VTTPTGLLSGVSVSHHRGGIDDIEAVSHDTQQETVERLLEREGVDEAFVLQTCNRAEAFVVTEEDAVGRAALAPYIDPVEDAVVDELDHEASLRHLMRVAAGLESLVVGEDQIIGQLREAYEDAREVGGVGPVLEEAVVKALRVGERARTETPINEGITSLGSAAVRMASDELDLEGTTALVVGAGEMGALAARALDGVVERVVVVNRSLTNAEHLAESLDGPATAVGLEALPIAVSEVGLVVTATASTGYVLDEETLASAGETVVVDLAQPRDVAPGATDLKTVTLRDLDALEAVTAETRDRRRAAAEAVEEIIDEEFDRLVTQYKRKRADEVIAAMYEGAEKTKEREVRTALARLESAGDLNDDQREVVASLADALVGQLLAPPTRSLRDAAENDEWSTINTALRLFGPSLELRDESHIKTGEPDRPASPETADVEAEDIPESMRERMPDRVLERLGD
jgi:glutamyl-tRNA reductase